MVSGGMLLDSGEKERQQGIRHLTVTGRSCQPCLKCEDGDGDGGGDDEGNDDDDDAAAAATTSGGGSGGGGGGGGGGGVV